MSKLEKIGNILERNVLNFQSQIKKRITWYSISSPISLTIYTSIEDQNLEEIKLLINFYLNLDVSK